MWWGKVIAPPFCLHEDRSWVRESIVVTVLDCSLPCGRSECRVMLCEKCKHFGTSMALESHNIRFKYPGFKRYGTESIQIEWLLKEESVIIKTKLITKTKWKNAVRCIETKPFYVYLSTS
jgi:hypothetical protein